MKRPTRWVGFKDHVPCARCNGTGAVELAINDPQAEGLALVRKCPKCANFYAVGAGKPKREPCYQNHAKPAPGRNLCCHWHDKSMAPPGQPITFISDVPSPWEQEIREKPELVLAK